MPIKPGELDRQLRNKFYFIAAKNHSDDHKWLELRLPGLPLIYTKLSHSKDELRDILIGKIARQLHVSSSFLYGMVECSKSKEAYYRQVQEAPNPPFTGPATGR
jgi:hypothetical protein